MLVPSRECIVTRSFVVTTRFVERLQYTRANAGTMKSDTRSWTTGFLDERAYKVIDALGRIAGQLDTTVARVALAWVQAQPGVSSTIIGARTLAQLNDNVQALEVKLTAAQAAELEQLTTPMLDFPAGLLGMAAMLHAGGTTVNGVKAAMLPQFGAPTKPGDFY